MRHLPEVIDEIIKTIPPDQHHLVSDISKIRTRAIYAAPEDMKRWWYEVALTLESYFPDPNNLNEWQNKVVNIFMDKQKIS